ncbi:MAG: hypothetical protein Q8S33_17280 [Myxococcales bacterium]|nr:hypothetical protein [Myxococcales bacterium]MDP3502093.1 hypothetical protein [Myxococcales bacterium]
MSRSLLVCLSAVSCGCSSSVETAPGSLGALVPVRSGVPVPADVKAEGLWSALVEICPAEPFAPATVRVTWRTATAGSQAWISDVAAELVESSSHLTVDATPRIAVGGKHLDPDKPWVDLATLSMKCRRKQFRFPRLYEQSLQSMVQFDALGEISVDGQPATKARLAP